MLPFFATPWALLALAGVPALAAIYWLRHRFRRVPVSSLMLWLDEKEAREGGLRVRRLQTPLTFFLELLAVLLVVLAAAGPRVLTEEDTRPLVIVLDDSFSMRAGGADSARNRAVAAIEQELREGRRYAVRFVQAGQTPQLLGEPVQTAGQARELLDRWQCRSPAAPLERAAAFAAEIGGGRSLILVVTDRAPASEPERGRVRWWAFGEPRPNIAFVNAARTPFEGTERCLLEVANLSGAARTTTLRVSAGGKVIHRARLTLAPHETRRVLWRLKTGTPTLTARIDDDALDIDNRVTLLAAAHKPVRVAVRLRDAALQTLVEKALRATGKAALTNIRPDLVFTDREDDAAGGPDAWRVRLLAEKEAVAFAGPFVLDRSHPLTEGLSLQGVIWGGGKTERLPGLPVVLAGNVPLLTDTADPTGRHDLCLRLRPDLSTLPQSLPQSPA
jgi:hypothetical protein